MGIWKIRTGVPVDGCAMVWRTSSPSGPNKVVICNIHVLFNPRRGEIKLGQVRVLLDKAQAVSKIWNDAPIVICGDFNCTPKSALYNFISNQKLDLSEVDRDKVSGQASAEIPPQTRDFRSHSGIKSNPFSVPTPAVVDNMNSNSEHNVSSEKQLSSQSYSESDVRTTATLEDRDKVDPQSSSAEVAVDLLNDETGAASHMSNVHLKDSQNDNFIETHDTAYQAICESDSTIESATAKEGIGSSFREKNQEERATALEGSPSDASVAIEFDVSENFEGLSLNAEDIGEDSEKFLSELHLGDEILEDLTHRIESVEVEDTTYEYDPSLWTPMEIAIATGNAECTILEHPLKLRSTYAEVEGSSDTRESSGEPVLTSYNTCFMGTVDYIWRSEGIQTLRVLGPLPKNAVQWTQGFPTRKWGSDHIALVSELAFTKDSE